MSKQLGQRIADEIARDGPMPFQRYMQMALYEPGLGYYVNGLHKFGASGDFVTAPEQGPIFSATLARQVDDIAQTLSAPYTILEPGAGSGAMACGLLSSLEHLPQHYLILEPSAALREVQRERLAQLPEDVLGRVEWIEAPPGQPFNGVIIANEVADALPVAVFRMGSAGLAERCVQIQDNRLGWADEAPRERLSRAVTALQARLNRPFEEGYVSEISLDLAGWLDTLTAPLERGAALIIDYGYPSSEYYLPERSAGTLVCHYRHRAHFDPFVWPGLTDLSAFVDFSACAEAALGCGLDIAGFTSQADFLLGLGAHELVEQAGDPREQLQRAGELKQLIMPGEMGEKFKVLGLSRGLDLDWRGFSLSDQRHRLSAL